MARIYIAGRRNGYTPDQCGKTMTVGELIEYLECYNDFDEIFLRNDGGYTYGNITEDSLMCSDDMEEDEE
jgi:hypothetical protein